MTKILILKKFKIQLKKSKLLNVDFFSFIFFILILKAAIFITLLQEIILNQIKLFFFLEDGFYIPNENDILKNICIILFQIWRPIKDMLKNLIIILIEKPTFSMKKFELNSKFEKKCFSLFEDCLNLKNTPKLNILIVVLYDVYRNICQEDYLFEEIYKGHQNQIYKLNKTIVSTFSASSMKIQEIFYAKIAEFLVNDIYTEKRKLNMRILKTQLFEKLS